MFSADSDISALLQEAAAITKEMVEYTQTMTIRTEDNGYQCLVCSSFQKQHTNMKKHMLSTHKFGRLELVKKLDKIIKPYYIVQEQGAYSCMICRKILKAVSFNVIRMHFIFTHLYPNL